MGAGSVEAAGVGLAGDPTGILLAGLLARTLGAEDEFEGALRGRRVLLVLDNAEHVSGACAQLVGRLLGECPALTVLTTSSSPLDLADETVWEVAALCTTAGPRPGALDAHPAVRLFLCRARVSAPDMDLSGRLPLVWELCRRLGGSPLAIEMAAARLRSMSPDVLRERIAAGPAVPLPEATVGAPVPSPPGAPGDAPGEGDLTTAVRWSHDLLSGSERLLLGRLAVFAGTFPLDAAEEVAGWGTIEAAAPILGTLVDAGFVQPDGDERYRLLPPLRELALARAGAEDLAAARRRHQDRYLRLAEQTVGDTDPSAALTVGAELAEILLAIERAAVEDAAAVTHALDIVTSARALLDRLDHGGGDLHGAIQRARSALSATRGTSSRLTMLVGLLRQRETLEAGDRQVVTLHRRRLTCAVRRRKVCATLVDGQEAVAGSELERAAAELERARTLLDAADPRERLHLAAVLVDLAGLTADPGGVSRLHRAVGLARTIGDPEPTSAILARAAEQLAWRGRCAEADMLLGEAPLLDRHRQRLAVVDLLAGRLGIARAHAQAVAEPANRPLPPRARVTALLCLCWIDVLGGDPAAALRRLEQTEPPAERTDWTAALPEYHRVRAHAYWRDGRQGEAAGALRSAVEVAVALPDPQAAVRALHLAAVVARDLEHSGAVEIARLARTCRARSGLPPWPFGESDYAGWESELGVAGDPVGTGAAVDSLVLTAADRVVALLTRE